MNSMKNHNDHLHGVTCAAGHCAYQKEGMCRADHISVKSENAIRQAETFCSTFSPKS